jgi:CheY-like chemotaxis protein
MDSLPSVLLVVDDDQHVRELVRAAAEQSGLFARVDEVADGQAALELIQRSVLTGEAPDFILSDLSMPRMDGLQLIQALKAAPETRHIPIAIMTSSNLPNDRSDALTAGCCVFFEKPTRFSDIVKMVESLPTHCAAH